MRAIRGSRRLALFLLAASAGGLSASAAEWRVDTVAGTGRAEDGPATGPALETNVGEPFGVEFGPDGALYVCEVRNHRVRRLDLATGELSTVAGCGRAGYSGDGGPATAAELREPYEVRFDAEGQLFCVEMQNHVVRRVDRATGRISTVAGTGEAGFGGDGGPAREARLRQPHSIALDGRGGLYIADIGNHRLRRVDLASGRIETVSGTGEKRLPRDGAPAHGEPLLGPRALWIGGDVLWLALREGNSLWRLDLAEGVLSHAAGTGEAGFGGDGGPARAARMSGPKGVAVDAAGVVYLVDTENHAIRAYDPATGTVTTLAGGPGRRGPGGDGGPAAEAQFDRPHGVCVGPDGSIYVGDTNNHRVRRLRRVSAE